MPFAAARHAERAGLDDPGVDNNAGWALLRDLSAPGEPAEALATTDIIFIDTGVEGYAELAREWAGRGEVVLIDAARDGIDQIMTALVGRSDIDAIHIVSHGTANSFTLGTTVIDRAAVTGELAGAFASIGSKLTADGDILIYGCDTGVDEQGQELVDAIARVTGADVAASADDTDDTGAAALGGDWDLEARAGLVETAGLVSDHWNGLLTRTNSGAWTVGTGTASTVREGITTIISFTGAGTSTFTGLANDTFNNIAAFDNSAQGTPSLSATWTANNTADIGTITITFSQAVVNPVINIDRLGGVSGTANSALLTLLTSGATLTKLAGPAHMVVGTSTITRQIGVVTTGTESSLNSATGSAAGSVRVNGTFTTLTFSIRMNPGAAAGAGDGFELGVAIDAPPDAVNDNLSTNEDVATFNGNLFANNGNGADSDPRGDAFTVSAAQNSAGTAITIGTATTLPSGATLTVRADGTFSYLSNGIYNSLKVGETRTETFTYTVRDANGGTDTATATITIVGVNDAPVAVNDSEATAEDTPVTITVLGNDNDPDGDPLTVTAASATNGTVVRNADGTITYTPNANFSGTDTITYTISDGQGGTATATVTVTVAAVNDAPVPVGTLPNQSSADAASGVSVATAGGFNDVDNATLTYSVTGLPAGLSINTATGVITGTIDRSASQLNGGVYSVVVTARDTAGLAATQAFTWTVTNPAPVAANNTVSTPEDTPVTINVLANDSDPDGDPLAVVAAVASIGQATINPNNSITYTPPANFNGSVTINYTISDGQGGTATATVTINVTAAQDAPEVVTPLGDRSNVDAQTGISVATAGSFSDIDGDTLTYAATGLPAGLSINAATGVISGTIDRSASQVNGGSYSVQVTVTNPGGRSVATSFTWTVTNPAPTAGDDSATTNEDTPVTIAVLANDSDADGDPLTVTQASALNGSVTINPNGTLSYTPNANFNGTDTISYAVSDGEGGTATAMVTVTVNSVNDGPVAGTIGNHADADNEGVSFSIAGAFVDSDGDALTYGATGLPAGISIDPATGVISGTIDNSASQMNGGVYTVTVTANDGNGGIASSSFTWTITNPAPTAANDSVTTNEDIAVRIPVLANDSDPDGDVLTVVSASADVGSVSINPDGSLQYVPPADFNGTATISYTISDGEGGQSTATVTVNAVPINDAPVTTGLAGQSGVDGGSVSVPTEQAFSDVDGDVLTFAASGLPPGLTIDPATGLISGTLAPDASDGTPYAVQIFATDPNGATISTTFQWDVANVGPTATNDSATTPEDTPVIVNVLANDADPDGDALTVTAASATGGTVVINPDNSLTFTPDTNFNGTATISYTVRDADGTPATATVTVTVTPANDAPVAGTPLPARANLDGDAISVPVAGSFSDIDGDALTYSATGLPPGLTIDAATGVISGTIDRSASQTGGGVYSVVVTARDPGGAAATQSFSWAVTNPGPAADGDSATTAEGTPVIVNVLGNDVDPDGDPLTVTAASAANGAVVINPDGTLTYTPNANFNGTDTISYTISDGQGGTSTSSVTVTVTAVNDPPVATNDTASTNEDTPVQIGILGNDGDIDGDPLTVTAATAANGTVAINADGTVTYTPNANFNGTDTISYTISDGNGGTSTATVTVTVAPVNDPPVAVGDAATTDEDTPVTIGVLANDSDIDGDPLTITAASAANGTVVRNGDGTLTYTPDANFNGTDTITYTISDGNGGFSTATVTVTVDAVNDGPIATPPLNGQVSIDGAAASVTTANNFVDPDGDVLTYSATGLPPGLTINAATGVISGTIDRSASQTGGGTYNVVVTATDTSGASAISPFTWTVTNPAPTANNDTATTAEDTPVTIPVLANDTDPDGDPLRVTSATATNGTVVVNANGTITYTPGANFNGTDTIVYTITDDQGGTSTASVTVTVTPVQDAPAVVTPLGNRSNVDAQAGINVPTAASFADVDGDTLTYSAAGLPAGLTIDPATGVISGTIDRGASQVGGGSYSVQVTATDPGGRSVTTGFTWTVANPTPTAGSDSAATSEDTPVTITVLANDSDPDGDPLTVTAATATNGTVVRNADGTLTYTPNSNFNGTDTISYTVSDGNGGTATATVTVTVAAVNDAPVPVGTLPPPPRTNADATVVSTPVAGAFSDVDNATLTYSAAGLPPGLTINAATGVITGTVANKASQTNGGIYSVAITATDANGLSATQIFSWTITNPPPTAANDTATTSEDTSVTIAVLANDTDPDGDALRVTSATAANGTIVINGDGTISYTPDSNFNGTDTITYTITDDQGGSSTATVTVTVSAANDGPIATPPLNGQLSTDASSASVATALNFRDADGDPLTYSATGLPSGLTIDPATGVISGTIAANASQTNGGVYNVIVTATDPSGASADSPFTWTVTNPAPSAANDIATTDEDVPVIIAVLANDNDPDGDPLTVASASAGHGTVVINGNGTITYTPDANFNGTDTINYMISDGQGGTATASVTVTVGPVNDAPTTDGLTNLFDLDAGVVSIPFSAEFQDVDGDALAYAATGLPLGLTIDPATGVVSGTIDPSASTGGPTSNGIYTVTITASDGNGGSVPATFTWTIDNIGPIANDDSATTSEDTPVTINVLLNDVDDDGDVLTVVGASASNGAVLVNADGTITYTPPPDFTGMATITYTIADTDGAFSTAVVVITVTPGNDAPASSPLSDQSSNDGDTIAPVAVAAFFSDIDNDTLTYGATGLPPGLTIDAATGVISGSITADASQANGGAYSVTVTATDPGGLTTSQTFTWTVANPAPAATNDTATTVEDTPVTIPVLANDSDPDGDPLTVINASATRGAVVINGDGTLTYTPDPDFSGPDIITYTISDGNGGTSIATVTMTVTPGNDAPTTVGLPDRFDTNSDPVNVTIVGGFDDLDGDALTYTATGLPAGLTLDPATGVISGTTAPNGSVGGPNGDGIYPVTVTVSDGNGGTVTTTFTWTISNVPPRAADDSYTTGEDMPIALDVLVNDVDATPLQIVAANATNGTAVINPDGTIAFTPDPDFSGIATVTYTVSDGLGGFSSAVATITVVPANDAPTASPLPPQNNLDAAAVDVATAASFSDLDGDALTYGASGLPAGLAIDPATGRIIGTIAADASQLNGGVYAVTVTATDPSGALVSSSFTWTVGNPPPVAANDAASTAEDTPVSIAVLANDADPDSDPLTVISVTATNGSVAINPDGTLAYTPNADFNGTDTITYTISDGQGGTSTATVTVTVTAANDPPAAANDSASTDEDTPVTIGVLGNDVDPDGDPLTVATASAANGTVTINPDGTISYTPNANFNGTDIITYTISDGNGGTSTATVSVVVTAANDPPVAANDTATTTEDTPVTVSILGNDTDIDGDPLTVTAASSPNGTVTINPDGTIGFVPNADFNGPALITYTISDGRGGTSTATVTVTVTPANDPPVAVNDTASTQEDTPVTIPVLTNDSDIDSDPLTVAAASAANGTVTINADGTIGYTPNANFNGTDTITYTISDGQGGTSTATVTVTVNAVNDPPVATNNTATTDEDTPVTIPVLANDSDVEGDPLTVTNANAANGTVTINPDGTISYTPNANFNGTDTITYTISDGQGGFSTATVTVTVNPVNDAPVAIDDATTTQEDTPVTIPVLANDTDPDGDPLTVIAGSAANGTVTINSDGTITYAPNPNFNGNDVITYTISDGNGGTSTATVVVTVNPVNDPPVAVDDTASTDEDMTVIIPVLANDSDIDADPLTVTAASAANGNVTINPDGTISYTPNVNFNGTDTITYTISDGQGGTSTATATVTVNPVNDPPIAANDSATTDEDTPVAIPVLGNDSDIDGDPLTVTAATAPNGTVTINADGTIVYTPNAGFNGTDTITYSISDGQGGTSTATVTITVNPVNDPPVAADDTATTEEDNPVTIPVLGNDSDPEGDPLTVTAATAPNGTVTINADGTISYTPNANFNGTDTITYTISDGNGGTSIATVTVTVNPTDDPPADRPETVTTIIDRPITVPVLDNASDPDGDPLTVISATPSIGMAVINADGTITYTPPLGFRGVATITYVVSDGEGGTVVSSFTVTIVEPGADINALLGTSGLGPNESYSIDRGLGTGERPFAAPLIILDAVNDISPLGGTADLNVGRPVLTAVNGLDWLKGTQAFEVDGHPVSDVVAHLDRLRELRTAGEDMWEGRFGGFDIETLTGFSARQLSGTDGQIMIESVSRGNVLYMEMRDIGDESTSPVVEFQLLMRDGRPLPDWIRMDARGLAIIERPVDADEIRLIVRGLRADGTAIEIPVIVQGATGEIQLDAPGKRVNDAAPLGRMIAAQQSAAGDETARLLGAFDG